MFLNLFLHGWIKTPVAGAQSFVSGAVYSKQVLGRKKERKKGMLKLGLLSHIAGNLYLQIVVWSGSHHRDFPRDAHAPKPMGWDGISPCHIGQ